MTQTASAPFTPAQVAAIEWLQRGKVLQPYTCPETTPTDAGLGKGNARHDETGRVLVATEDGLRCPGCGWVRVSVPAAVVAFAAERVNGDRPRAVAEKKGKRGKR